MAKADEKTSVTADASEEGKGSKAVTIIIVLVIVIIWLAIFGVLIKLDVGGFGSGVMYPILKDVPVLSMVLPEPKEAENNVKIYGMITPIITYVFQADALQIRYLRICAGTDLRRRDFMYI